MNGKIKALVLAFGLCSSTTNLSANSMQEVFDSINAQGNVSNPAIIQGQTMNYATGGSMFMRTPNSTYQLASMTAPSISASGCGGIDIYAGGFGHINKDGFVSLMRNIGSNALSYGFKLAIQNICPTCDNVMQALQSTAQQINRLNIDSCEAAKGIVNAATANMDLKGRENSAMNLGVMMNEFGSLSEAWSSGLKKDPAKMNDQIDKAANAQPELKDHIPNGNVVWKALKKVQGIDDDYRMMIMSLVGTVIFTNEKGMPVARSISGLESLMSKDLNRKVNIPILTCVDGKGADQCLDVKVVMTEMTSFNGMVQAKLDTLVSKISNRQPYSPSEYQDIIAFVNSTDLPIYKIVAVGSKLNNTAAADSMLNTYKDLIAAKYAQHYIEKATQDLRLGINYLNKNTHDNVTSQELQALVPQLDQLVANARQTMQTAYTQSISTYNIAQEVGHIERTLNSNLSQTVINSLNFGASLQ